MTSYDTTRLQERGKRRQKLIAQLAEVEAELDEEIPTAYAAGVAQADMVRWTGYSKAKMERKAKMTPEEAKELLRAYREGRATKSE